MRADRLVSIALLLQARGRMSADDLAAELEVSVRTIYRDISALNAAGIPVLAEPGRSGGCRLIDGYRFPLRGLSTDEAEALLILGVPAAVADLGLGDTLSAAHRKVSTSAASAAGRHQPGPPLVHLDMPRWFYGTEPVPHLRTLAEAVRRSHGAEIGYRRDPGTGGAGTAGASAADASAAGASAAGASAADASAADASAADASAADASAAGASAADASAADASAADASAADASAAGASAAGASAPEKTRTVLPLGLVNKAGTWYLVADRQAAAGGRNGGGPERRRGGDPAVFRVGRVTAARLLPAVTVTRPDGFDLAAFWDRWSAAFVTSKSQIPVLVRATAAALAIFPYVFGEPGRTAAAAAGPADGEGLREVTLSFEEEAVAVHRLAGFGGDLRVIAPEAVRDGVIATARDLLARYES